MLERKLNSKKSTFGDLIKKKIVYQLFTRLLIYTTFVCLMTYCILDFSNYDFKTVKYVFLYTSVFMNLCCLALLSFV